MKTGKFRVITIVVVVMLFSNICMAGGLMGKNASEIIIGQWVTDNPPDIRNLANRVYVLEFWATWCRPCVKRVPEFIELNNKYRNSGLEFISLSQDKSVQKVRDFVQQKGINYHVAIDNGTADWFGVEGYPTVVVVDHRGKITWQGFPWSSEFEKAIQKAISVGPPPLLTGVNLGAFEHHRKNLWGGKGFLKSYRTIESQLNSHSQPENSATARVILQAINEGIEQKIRKADRLKTSDPATAYNIYLELVTKYGGIEAIRPAQKSYLELKDQINRRASVGSNAL
jgi:thiol-disulfide isomerase/thioredoxin